MVNHKDLFFYKLNNEIAKLGNTRKIIILGGLNSRTDRKKDNKIVGQFGEDQSNDNENRLIEMCEQNDLKILNGYFQHRSIHKFTWTQTTKNIKSIID